MNNKALSLVGLAMRAGKIVSGEERVILAIRKQQLRLVILSTDSSANTMKKVIDKCTYYQMPYLLAPSRDELGRAIGKEQRVVVGVTDAGFATKIIEESKKDEHRDEM